MDVIGLIFEVTHRNVIDVLLLKHCLFQVQTRNVENGRPSVLGHAYNDHFSLANILRDEKVIGVRLIVGKVLHNAILKSECLVERVNAGLVINVAVINTLLRNPEG